MTDGALRDIQEKMEKSLPYEAENLFNYIERLKGELTRMAKFVCDDYRSQGISDWNRAKSQVKQAFAVVGIEGAEVLPSSEIHR